MSVSFHGKKEQEGDFEKEKNGVKKEREAGRERERNGTKESEWEWKKL